MKFMGYIPITSFRRMVDAVQLQQHHLISHPLPARAISKWDALRELATARASFGLTDRDLTVLQALLSFYPGTNLDQPEKLIVHPSNESICDRLNGMPCSTMRRHLAKLVSVGVIARRDSPNGKRYVRRSASGPMAYGFDLSPLAHRFDDFAELAQQVREDEQRLNDLRHSISLMRRDLRGLLEFPEIDLSAVSHQHHQGLLDGVSRQLRRKLDLEALAEIAHVLKQSLSELTDLLAAQPIAASVTEEMSTSPAENEQHYQNQTKYSYESEIEAETQAHTVEGGDIALPEVLSVCSEITSYSEDPVRHWPDFLLLAEKVRPMIGISAGAWQRAQQQMGTATAAVVLAAILQRLGSIRSPAAYLQALAKKASAGQFTPAPMVRALLRPLESSQL